MNDKKISSGNNEFKETDNAPGNNKDRQDDDKAPGEENGQGEKVTNNDLKGKKVDADLSIPEDQPLGKSGK